MEVWLHETSSFYFGTDRMLRPLSSFCLSQNGSMATYILLFWYRSDAQSRQSQALLSLYGTPVCDVSQSYHSPGISVYQLQLQSPYICSIAGFNELKSVGGYVAIHSNSVLTTVPNFTKLEKIGSSTWSSFSLYLVNNGVSGIWDIMPALTSIDVWGRDSTLTPPSHTRIAALWQPAYRHW